MREVLFSVQPPLNFPHTLAHKATRTNHLALSSAQLRRSIPFYFFKYSCLELSPAEVLSPPAQMEPFKVIVIGLEVTVLL